MSQTKQEIFSKQVPIAIEAIGHHAAQHGLGGLINIDIRSAEQVISCRVADEQNQTAWLNTLVILGEENTPWQGPIWIRTAWSVQLPDLGVKFEIVGLRRNPLSLAEQRRLAVVPA